MQYWLFPRRATINLAVDPEVHAAAGRGDQVYFLDDSGAVSLYGVVWHGEPSHPVGNTLRVRCYRAKTPITGRKMRGLLGGRRVETIQPIEGDAAEELGEIVGQQPRTLLESLSASLPDWRQIAQMGSRVLGKSGAKGAAGADPVAEAEPAKSWLVPPSVRLEQRVSAANYRRIEPGARVLWQRRDGMLGDWGTVLARRSWGDKRHEYRVLVTQLPLAGEIELPPAQGAETGDGENRPQRPRERLLTEAEAAQVRQATTGMPSSFEEAFREELEEIARLRRLRGYQARRVPEPVVYHQAHRAELAGLAFSGGGIRSATFNLGVLQALAERGLLAGFDYLSTVSGGGYIGSWLVAWIKRRGLAEVEQKLQREHPEVVRNRHLAKRERRVPLTPLTYLRRYSNFLTPRLGAFGPDSWTVIATYARNLLLNLLILVTALSALLLAPRVSAQVSTLLRQPGGRTWALALALGSLLIGLFYLFRNILSLSDFLAGEPHQEGEEEGPPPMATGAVQAHVMLPLLVAAWAGSCAIWLWQAGEGARQEVASWGVLLPESWRLAMAEPLALLLGVDEWVQWMLGCGLVYLALWLPVALAAVLGFVYRRSRHWLESDFRQQTLRGSRLAWFLWWRAFVAGLGGGLLLWWLTGALFRLTAAGGGTMPVPALYSGLVMIQLPYTGFPLWVLWGPPVMVLVMVVTAALHIGLMGRDFAEDHRQWWSRLGAWMLIVAIGWIGLGAIAVYGPVVLEWLAERGAAAFGTISLGWVASTLAGIWAARNADAGEGRSRWLELLAKAAPYMFVLGLLAVLAAAIQATIGGALGGLAWEEAETVLRRHLAHTWEHPESSLVALVAAAVALGGLSLWLSYRIDINEFSMHLLYRSRLVRAYLGASRARRPHPFTGFDRDDDLPLASLLQPPGGDEPLAEPSGQPGEAADQRVYAGPLPILNTALNLSAGGDLAQQERKANSFFFTPLHYGFDTGVEPAEESERGRLLLANEPFAVRYTGAANGGRGISLGTAMTVSGAALSPNMGYQSSAPLAFLLTVFNARLGLWLGNPRRNATWEMAGPSIGLIYLLAELFGQTKEDARYVSLADGGFFDNLGIYELVRRRCRYIVACDAEGDPDLEFAGLANVVRKCRSDFGVEIDIDIEPIETADGGLSDRHCAVGRIHYPDERARPGVLVYIKASLTGDEPEDLMAYRKAHPGFPHESTGDQWFDESQFESYRTLGRHICGEVFDAADLEAARSPKGRLGLEPVFVDLRQAWYQPSHAIQQSFTQHTELLIEIFERLRSEKNLAYLVPQVYRETREWRHGRVVFDDSAPPELTGGEALPHKTGPDKLSPAEFQEGFFLCNSVMQLMENVYLDLRLEQEWNHPDNRGWLNMFRHWSWSWMFRLTWAVSASTFGARFQKFCERRLGIPTGEIDGPVFAGPPFAERPEELNAIELDLARRVDAACDLDKGSRLVTLPLRLEVLGPRSSYRLGLDEAEQGSHEASTPNVLYRFTFGFAVLLETESASGGRPARQLLFLRVRDHLRKLGLGRRSLRFLLAQRGLSPVPPNLPGNRLEEVLPDYRHTKVRDLLLSAWTEYEFERRS